MSITLDDLKQDQRTCAVEFGGQSAEVTYRPQAFTPQTEDRLATANETKRPAGGLAAVLADVLVDWDVVDQDGKRIAPTLDFVQTLPTVFLVAVVNAITEDQEVNREEVKNSGGGSLQGANKGKRRNGTR